MDLSWLGSASDLISSLTALIQLIVIAVGIIGTISCVHGERYGGAVICGIITIIVFLNYSGVL